MALSVRGKLLIRVLTLGVPMLVLYVAMQIGSAVLRNALPGALRPAVVGAYYLFASAILWAGYRFAIRRLEHREAHELGRAGAVRGTLIGFAIGLGLFTATEAIIVALGYAHVDGYGGMARVLPLLAGAVLASVGEEIVFRGILFRLVREAVGAPVALAVSAVLFGGLHVLNPDATLAGMLGIALEAGVLLGLVYMWTGSLWLPIGVHIGWNLTAAAIFGNIVSGTGDNGPGVVTMVIQGPALWTGGKFGPEASLPAIAVCLLTSIVLVIRRRPRAGDRGVHW